MATMVRRRSLVESERRFFLIMACVIAATVFTGFGLDQITGRAWFGKYPWPIHVHAVVFSAWIILYVIQNWLIVDGNAAVHRRLGWLAAALALLMVPLGIMGTVFAIERGSVPPFFPPGIFLMIDGLSIMAFGALTLAAILLRRDAAWHKRLMLCGTIIVMSPAIGRILPMPLLGPSGPLAIFGAMIAYVLAGVIFDLAVRGRIHPAYGVGLGSLVLVELSIAPLGFSPPVLALVARIAAS